MWEGLGANSWADSQLCSSYKLFQNNFLYLSIPPICACVCVLCKKKKKLSLFIFLATMHDMQDLPCYQG